MVSITFGYTPEHYNRELWKDVSSRVPGPITD